MRRRNPAELLLLNPAATRALTMKEVSQVMRDLGVPKAWRTRFMQGMDVEWREHGGGIDAHSVGNLVVDHLNEDVDYYRRARQNPEGTASFTPQTQTPAFRRWFGDSKVVDENGEPLVVYHGTDNGGFFSFNLKVSPSADDSRRDGMAFFTSSRRIAETYASKYEDPTPPIFTTVEAFLQYVQTHKTPFEVEVGEDANGVFYKVFSEWGGWLVGSFYVDNENDAQTLLSNLNTRLRGSWRSTPRESEIRTPGVYEVYLRIENPLVLDAKSAAWNEILFESGKYKTDELANTARLRGHDGLIILNVGDSGQYGNKERGDIYVIFDEKQVKSAHKNIGTFDPNDSDIRRNPHAAPPSVKKNLDTMLDRTGKTEDILTSLADIYAERAQTPQYARSVEQMHQTEHALRSAAQAVEDVWVERGQHRRHNPVESEQVEGADRLPYLDTVWSMYVASYSKIGLIVGRAEELLDEYDVWEVSVDENGVPRAFCLYKRTPFGLKVGLSGSDGSPEGRAVARASFATKYQRPGVYGEVSHRPAELARAAGVPVVCANVASVVLRKQIEPVDDVHYVRNLVNVGPVQKMLVGLPIGVPTTDIQQPVCPAVRMNPSRPPTPDDLADLDAHYASVIGF